MPPVPAVPRFDRRFFDGTERFTRIGDGAVGGKATGLLRIHDVLRKGLDPAEFPGIQVDIPTLTVIATNLFEAFLERNRLGEMALSDEPDERIASAFQRADLPAELAGDLRALVEQTRTPLAVRSSSRLEDALYRPFAGVYGTKMIPNDQPDADSRFRGLVEAVKFVWASTFFAGAKAYVRATDRSIEDERMAVIIQEIVGRRHRDRFYPVVSGVARSYGFYRSGPARPEDGVVSLALGLGKTIVDGGLVWSYSPAHPAVGPPFGSASALLEETQTEFWAVHMGKPPAYDPIRETEYLVRCGLSEAEKDGTLRWVASTYDPDSDRLAPGTGRSGPRAVTFAPLLLLDEFPLNALVKRILAVCEDGIGEKVEIEFALNLDTPSRDPSSLGFLQVRPMVVSDERVDVLADELEGEGLLLSSDNVMGNGVVEGVRDVVYVKPEGFEAGKVRQAAMEIGAINREMLEARRPYVLIGFGRWGSSIPSLGIPVGWGDICGARAVVEATIPVMNVDLSQGSHFFHNISSFGVSYFSVRHDGSHRVDWEWLARQPAIRESDTVRHVRASRPLVVKVDGRTGRGVIRVERETR